MGSYWASVETDQDLDTFQNTELNWGKSQALEYIDSLINCFKKLARSPELGREVLELYPGEKYARLERFYHLFNAPSINTQTLTKPMESSKTG